MKKIGLLISLLMCCLLLTGCFERKIPLEQECIVGETCRIEQIDENEYIPVEERTKVLKENPWDWVNKDNVYQKEWLKTLDIGIGVYPYSNFHSENFGNYMLFESNSEDGIISRFAIYYKKDHKWLFDCFDGGGGGYIEVADDIDIDTVDVMNCKEKYDETMNYLEKHYESDDRFLGYIETCEKQIGWEIEDDATDISYVWRSKANIGNSWNFLGNVTYQLNGNFYKKDIKCTFIYGDYDVELDYYNAQGNITTKSDEELECLDLISQSPQEQISKNPLITASLDCYDLYGNFFTGYIYTTEYTDLGVRITTPAGWRSFEEDSIFNKKSDKPIFIRNGNRISYIQNGEEMEYLQVFEKSKNESLEEIIITKHLNEGCKLGKDIINYYHQNIVVAPGLGTEIYEPIGMDGDGWEGCVADDENKTGIIDYKIPRYFESPDKTKYYKLIFTDGCAPGPCTIFGKVETL